MIKTYSSLLCDVQVQPTALSTSHVQSFERKVVQASKIQEIIISHLMDLYPNNQMINIWSKRNAYIDWPQV
jgi:hypothetical protein